MAATEAQALVSIAKNKAEVLGTQLSEHYYDYDYDYYYYYYYYQY